MRTICVISILAFVMLGCGGRKPPPLPAATAVDDSLVGAYYQGDGLGYNLRLSLQPNGEFSCSWTGCLGDYGSTKGIWGRSGDTVVVSAAKSDGMFLDSPLTNMRIVRLDGEPYLLQKPDIEFMEKHSYGDKMLPSIAFRRTR